MEPPFMNIVRATLKAAMRAGDHTTKNTLRDVMSSVKNANLAKAGSVASDVSLHGLMQKLIDSRLKSAGEYAKGGRQALADNEHAEIKVLKQLLDQIKVASPAELEQRLESFIGGLDLPAEPKQKIGRVMAELKKLDLEGDWNASSKSVAQAVQKLLGVRKFSTCAPRGTARGAAHDNPLGIRRRSPQQAQGKRRILGVKHIVLVSSAKGGVGKSTVAVNLAQALFEQGAATGILDADIFGPSIPTLLNLCSEPKLDGEMLLPLSQNGLKAMSMGFLVPPDKAVAWRGLLIQKALQQLLFEVKWGQLDFLVVDMPPGTGDIQLTIAQQLEVDGAVVVTTPQDIALADAVRGISMFRTVGTRILGLVNNMSLFECPNCSHVSHIFGSDGALRQAKEHNIEVLASIPLSTEISDSSVPVVLKGGESAKRYEELARRVSASFAGRG